MRFIKDNWHRAALILILALTGFLSFYAIGNEGYANQYYSAAVKSMLESWHNFFFASFDPGGYVTVDKPAMGLWLQAASAWVFGFHGWSLILPEALSAVVSTALVYHLVQKFFGRAAGIASALIFALTPIVIAVSRTNNLDSSLVMVLLLAVWALIKASEKGSLMLLLLSMALVGLGFNIKMLQAFMVLPAFCLVYLFTAPVKIKKRIVHLAASIAVLLVVSLSWALAVDLTPAEDRPYVGGSKTNSVIELALGYNGLQRVTGRDFGGGGRMTPGNDDGGAPAQNIGPDTSGKQMQAPPDNNFQRNDGNRQDENNNLNGETPNSFNGGDGTTKGFNDRNGAPGGFGGRDGGSGAPGGFSGNMGGGPGSESENGQKGIFRIFNQQLAGQISWMLPMALFGILAFCFRLFASRDDRRKIIRYLLLWGGCIFPMLAFFSMAGFYHRYYLSMLAPGIAALAGAGLVEMWKAYTESGWKWVMLPSSLLATAGIQAMILSRYASWNLLVAAVCGICAIATGALILIRLLRKDSLQRTIKGIVTVSFLALLTTPAIWAYTPIAYGSQTTLPIAGPELKREGNFNMGGRQGFSNGPQSINNTSSGLVQFLLKNRQGEKYILAVADANSAASIILETGEPVMAVGGFSGADNILTVERLEKMVVNGEIRYFQIGNRGMGGQSDITNWVMEHGTLVSANELGGQNNMSLYDLALEKTH